MHPIAIIGGTGVYDPAVLDEAAMHEVSTPYGTVPCVRGKIQGKSVVFMARHGSKHTIPPHKINYRANIFALKKLGVKMILATTAVGSLNFAQEPGNFVIADQFIDFTKNRITSFFEGDTGLVVHIDVTEPYCPKLRRQLLQAAAELGITAHAKGTYLCTEGPRFETPAEIAMFRQWGADVVGMTNVPEVTLAREAELCYATISMVTNFAAGISLTQLTHGEVVDTMKANEKNLQSLLLKVIDQLDPIADCSCQQAMAEYGGFHLHEQE